MVLDPTFFALAVPAVIFAGVSKGGFGSGAAFAAAPLLALVLEPAEAVGLMLPLLMLIDVATLKPYWRRWDVKASFRLVSGAIPGVALGAAFWSVADPDLLRFMIGAVALGFVAFQVSRARGWLRLEMSDRGPVFGMVAGLAETGRGLRLIDRARGSGGIARTG